MVDFGILDGDDPKLLMLLESDPQGGGERKSNGCERA